MSSYIIEEKNLVVRHSTIELIEHWAIAVSGLVLFASGLFQMPLSKRYGISKLPGMEWSADFMFTLKLHYIASVVFVGAAIFHVIYHAMLKETGMLPKKGDLKQSIEVVKTFIGIGEEPPFHKYLPEQRLAYVGMAAVILGLIVTGMIKVVKNVYMPDMPLPVVWWATTLHNVFFVLFFLAFLAHMAAIIIKPNRPMVRSIFTGNIRLDYAKHRHPLWIDEIIKHASDKTDKSSITERFNKEAVTWDDKPHRIYLADSIADAIIRQIPLSNDMDALDYGAGTGLVTLRIQPHVRSVTAADSASMMLERLKNKIEESSIENISTMELDLEKDQALSPEMKFSLIFSSMVFHHIDNVPLLFEKLFSILKPGGYIAIADIDPDGGEFHSNNEGVLHQGFDREYMKTIFENAGLNNITIETSCTIKRTTNDGSEKDFTLFLISGKK